MKLFLQSGTNTLFRAVTQSFFFPSFNIGVLRLVSAVYLVVVGFLILILT